MERTVKVLSGNRITIPKDMRGKVGIEVSDFVILRLEKGGIRVTPAEIKPRKGKE